jgi:hypothetical protein
MHEDGCDNCGQVAELYHNEASGLALCEDCDTAFEAEDDGEAEGTFHAELRLVIERAEGTPLAALVPQAEMLLALPEESVAALVAAAQSMVGAASFGR